MRAQSWGNDKVTDVCRSLNHILPVDSAGAWQLVNNKCVYPADINQSKKEPQDSARICCVFLWESVPALLSFESSFVYFAKQKNYSEGLLASPTPALDIPASNENQTPSGSRLVTPHCFL